MNNNKNKQKKHLTKENPAPSLPVRSCPGLLNIEVLFKKKKSRIRFHELVFMVYKKAIIQFIKQ